MNNVQSECEAICGERKALPVQNPVETVDRPAGDGRDYSEFCYHGYGRHARRQSYVQWEIYTLQTTSGGTQDILNQAKAQYPEIEVGPMDDISRSEDETAINLTVKSAYDATVLADGAGHTMLAYYGEDVEDVLEKVGVTLGVNDMVELRRMRK